MMQMILNVVKATLKAYWFVLYAVIWSASLYTLFYILYLPTPEYVKPIHFQYRSDCERDLNDALCSFPAGVVPLHDGTKDIRDGIRILSRGQKYQIILELEMPLSERNQNLGMFLSEIKMIDEKNTPIQVSSRSAMLPYRSYIIRMIRNMYHIMPLVFGFSFEKEVLSIPIFDDFQELSYRPAVYANVTIYAKHIQLYSAQLRIKALFTGIRYYMYQWPVIFTAISFTSLLCFMLFIMLWRAIARAMTEPPNVSQRSFVNPRVAQNNDLSENSDTESAVEEVNTENLNLNSCQTRLINRRFPNEANSDTQPVSSLTTRKTDEESIDHDKTE